MRQLSLYQLQYRFMEGPLSSRPPMYIVSIGDLPEPVTVLQCQSQSHLPRPSLCVHSAKPPSHLSLSNHLSGLSNSNLDNSISLLPCRLCGTFRKSTLYVSRSFTASSKTAFDLFVPRGEHNSTFAVFLQSGYLYVLSASVSPFAAKSAAILLFSWEGKWS